LFNKKYFYGKIVKQEKKKKEFMQLFQPKKRLKISVLILKTSFKFVHTPQPISIKLL
jgi:hypothetical protein